MDQINQQLFSLEQQKGQLITNCLTKNEFLYEKDLGEGQFSKVIQAKSLKDQSKVAIKIFKNDQNQQFNFELFKQEVQILEMIQNEKYVIQFIKKIEDQQSGVFAIVTELCDCNLTHIMEYNKFSIEQVIALSYQLLRGLILFQMRGIMHTDIKPDNILYSDFGLSKLIKNPSLEKTISSLAGNLIYMSPEVSNGVKPYTLKADVFSIGIVILQCMLGAQLKPEQIIFLKASLLVNVIPDIQSHPNYEFIDKIISYMVNFNKDQRLEPLRLIQKLKSFQKVDESCLNQLVLPKKQEFSQTNLKKSAFQQKQTNQNHQKQCNFQNVDHIQYQQEQQLPILYKNYSLQNLNYLNSVLPQNGNSRRIIKIQKITTITPLYQDFVQQNYFNGQIYYMPPQHNTPQYQEYSKPPFSKYPRNQNN
ncbi:hypothetical protein ABPG72_011366 [Tetrahymena utriculariae]